MSAREVIDSHLKRYKKEYAYKINNNYDYKRYGIAAISDEFSKLSEKIKRFEKIRADFGILSLATIFLFLVSLWFSMGFNPVVFSLLFTSLGTAGASLITHLKVNDLEEERYNLETIKRNLSTKKSNSSSSEMNLDNLKHRIDNLQNAEIFFQKHHHDEVLDSLELSNMEMFKIFEYDMSLLSFLYLKYKKIIQDGAIENMSAFDLKKLKITYIDKIATALENNPSIFFRDDEEKENEQNIVLSNRMNVSNTNLVINESITQRRRRFKGYSDSEQEEILQSGGSRKR